MAIQFLKPQYFRFDNIGDTVSGWYLGVTRSISGDAMIKLQTENGFLVMLRGHSSLLYGLNVYQIRVGDYIQIVYEGEVTRTTKPSEDRPVPVKYKQRSYNIGIDIEKFDMALYERHSSQDMLKTILESRYKQNQGSEPQYQNPQFQAMSFKPQQNVESKQGNTGGDLADIDF